MPIIAIYCCCFVLVVLILVIVVVLPLRVMDGRGKCNLGHVYVVDMLSVRVREGSAGCVGSTQLQRLQWIALITEIQAGLKKPSRDGGYPHAGSKRKLLPPLGHTLGRRGTENSWWRGVITAKHGEEGRGGSKGFPFDPV